MGMMMGKSCMLIAFMLLFMIHSSFGLTRCKKHEQEALLTFKHSFTRDSQRVLSSWTGDDCCHHWHGVSCDNSTGNVIKLNLTNSLTFSDYPTALVSSELSSSLLELKFLTHLDLSWNNFTGSRIPKFIGSMTQLRYLTLPYAGFSGPVPPQLGNLTNLIHLDLNDVGQYMLYTQERLEWASGLSKLQFLIMDGINMSQAYNSLQVLFRLPSLLFLSLWGCSLHNTHLSELLVTNTSTLQYLDVSHNNFEGPFPSFLKNMPSLQSLSLWTNNFNGSVPLWLCNMRRLEYLDFYQNKFSGSLPSQLGQLTNLNYLDLASNAFRGQLPTSLAKLTALKHLDLSNNGFSGLIPDVLGQLTELESLDISSNFIHGTISHIGNLSELSILNMNFNNIKLNLSTAWQPPFQLQYLGASSCEINMAFPQWLRNQTQIERLDLSYTGITGELPQWVWNFTNLNDLQVAGNKLTGSLPRHIPCDGCNLVWLDLHNNMLSGTIPFWLKHQKTIAAVDLSQNLLSERIFEGENASSLLSGSNSLELLDLSYNMFSGEIQVKNVSSSASLVILSLRGNNFSGPVSSQLCHFTYLAILELAHNRLSGHIPSCLGSQIFESDVRYDSSADTEYQEIIKGTTENIGATMSAQSIIDLSCNLLDGTIPEELTNISKLMQLNLSNNHLTGGIPYDIGKLKLLGSLDLSNNNLSGTIPQSLSDIPWLSVLNLSNNHLHGPIPTGSQLQTLDDPSIYAGNSGLCGFPLPKKCSESKPPPTPTDGDHGAEEDEDAGDKNDKLWLYLAIMSGVATGFWGVVGTLVLKDSWRHAYFKFVEETAGRIYILFKVRLKRSRSTET
ncbi:receptor-like protein EIX2 [Silene latifolia]|uniref:receptor-like protein EIX2 n=1 Tax=Silene latifolia TaxID=37657 RepID=UPI003D77A247